jgi:hypothetical protein
VNTSEAERTNTVLFGGRSLICSRRVVEWPGCDGMPTFCVHVGTDIWPLVVSRGAYVFGGRRLRFPLSFSTIVLCAIIMLRGEKECREKPNELCRVCGRLGSVLLDVMCNLAL